MGDIPRPLWPLPDGAKPTVVKRGGEYQVYCGDVWLGEFHYHLDAMNAAREEAWNLSYATEYTERREALARFLLDSVYGEGAWAEAIWDEREELVLNYRLDADEIIKANPHLLSLGERERLEGLIPELRYGP